MSVRFRVSVLVVPLLAVVVGVAPACSKPDEVAVAPAEAKAMAADVVSGDPRFLPGDPASRASTAVGFAGDGIYLSPSSPHSLVLLRSDGEYAPLSLLEPESNHRNQWQFGMPGTRISTSDPRLASMVKLPHEGFYKLVQEFRFGDDGLWISGAIVQLGYTREAEPILFIAQRPGGEDNTLFFSDNGVRIRRDQLKWLEPLSWYEDESESESESDSDAGL